MLGAPTLITAYQVVNVFKTHLLHHTTSRRATPSAAAIHQVGFITIQLAKFFLEIRCPEIKLFGTLDLSFCRFRWGAYIQYDDPTSRHFLFELGGIQVLKTFF